VKFHPIDNWLVVKARPQQETVGSLALPGSEAANSFFPILGDVLEAGPGLRGGSDGSIFPNRIKKGDVVLLNNLTARRLTVDLGNDVCMLRETDVACLVTDIPAAPLTLVKES
jgi:co-chaperonin GroES (HSP10)